MKRGISIPVLCMGLGFSFSLSASSQLVGSAACEGEKVHPNLFVSEQASLSGTVVDQSGATMAHITLEIRTGDSGKVLQSSLVDDRGRFQFTAMPAGEFRIVPVRLIEGKAERVSGFDPPQLLHCQASASCELRIVLPMRPTDLPYTFCPPK